MKIRMGKFVLSVIGMILVLMVMPLTAKADSVALDPAGGSCRQQKLMKCFHRL